MLSLLLVFSLSRLRTCQEMRFCRDNLGNEYPGKWFYNKNSMKKNDYEFSATLWHDNAQTEYVLHIYRIKESGFRIKIELPESQSSYRYDILHDDLIVNSTRIAKKEKISIKSEEKQDVIKSDDVKLVIDRNPLKFKFIYDDKEYLTINNNNFMLIEDGSAAPDEEFEGQKETFPHGKTAVGMSFLFNSKDTRITGFLEGNDPSK